MADEASSHAAIAERGEFMLFAGLFFGGRDLASQPSHYLSVADFAKHTQEEHDAHHVPQDDKMEGRPRAPATLAQWVKQAQNQARCFSLVYGWEHYDERMRAIARFEEMAEEHSHPHLSPRADPRLVRGAQLEVAGGHPRALPAHPSAGPEGVAPPRDARVPRLHA